MLKPAATGRVLDRAVDGRRYIELVDDPLDLSVGERVVIWNACGDVAAGEVVAPKLITTDADIQHKSRDCVYVRRPYPPQPKAAA